MCDRTWVRLVGLVAVILAVVGCSSAPAPCGEDGVEERPMEGPSMEAVEVFEEAAPWLLVESAVVAVGVEPASWHVLGDVLLPTADPTAEPGSPGTLEALKGDLEALFVDSFGFDPSHTDAWVVGGGLQGGTAVLFGEFDEADTGEPFEVGALEGFKIDMGGGTFDDIEAVDWAYAVPIDSPRPGIVLSMEVEKLERLESALGSEEPGRSLAVGERASIYEGLFAELGASTLAVASTVGDVAGLIGDTESAPDAAALGYAPEAIRIVLEGEDETLEAIDERVNDKVDEYRERMEEGYEEESDGDFVDDYIAVYGYHVFESVARQLRPEYEEGRMHVEVVIDELGWGSGLMMATAVLAGLWEGMSEFDEWDMDPWTPRPTGRLVVEEKIRAAAEYYAGEQTYCGDVDDCDHPWHVGGEPGEPVADDERVFPGGPGVTLVTMHTIPLDGEEKMPEPIFTEEVTRELDGDMPRLETDEDGELAAVEGERMPLEIVETEVVEYDFAPEDVLDTLGYDYESPSEFLITYETGPGVGTDATVTITVEADFDRDESGHHRLYQTLEVGEDGGVIFHDPVVGE